jgi:hypothetical protein
MAAPHFCQILSLLHAPLESPHVLFHCMHVQICLKAGYGMQGHLHTIASE